MRLRVLTQGGINQGFPQDMIRPAGLVRRFSISQRTSWVRSGGVRNLMGQNGSGQDVFANITGRVGSL